VAATDEIPGLGRKGDRPRLNPGVDWRGLRLSPTEGFVLSRVDGLTSFQDIAQVTGLGETRTFEILKRLRSEGVLLLAGETALPPRHVAPVAPSSSTSPRASSDVLPSLSSFELSPASSGTIAAASGPSLLASLDDGSPVDPAALALGPDLDDLTKARLIRLHRRLKQLAPRELLCLPPDADRKAAKRVYFAASKELHPDRFFGKDIGPFRAMLSDIFTQLTRAFEQISAGQ
jgi:hypothetical protein